MDELLADFLTETHENLASLDVALVTLESTPDDAETLSLIFRMVHTIKGTCGFLALPRLERVAHAAENVLGLLRDGKLPASPGVVSQILAALDRIRAIVAGIGDTGTEPEGDDRALISGLDATLSEHEQQRAPKPLAQGIKANDEPEMRQSRAGPGGAGRGRAHHSRHRRCSGRPDDSGLRTGADAQSASATRLRPGAQRVYRAPATALAHHV